MKNLVLGLIIASLAAIFGTVKAAELKGLVLYFPNSKSYRNFKEVTTKLTTHVFSSKLDLDA